MKKALLLLSLGIVFVLVVLPLDSDMALSLWAWSPSIRQVLLYVVVGLIGLSCLSLLWQSGENEPAPLSSEPSDPIYGRPEIEGVEMEGEAEKEYVGLLPRFGATVIDGVWLFVVQAFVLTAFYGDQYWEWWLNSDSFVAGPMDFLMTLIFPAIAIISFWATKQATPGMMAVSARLVDANTGLAPSIGQCIGRYFAEILAILPLGLGLIWIAFDKRKQGWHDKLAGTVVVRPRVEKEPVRFVSG